MVLYEIMENQIILKGRIKQRRQKGFHKIIQEELYIRKSDVVGSLSCLLGTQVGSRKALYNRI